MNHMSTARELVTLRLGFEEGLFTRDDVRTWVDLEIVRVHELPAALLELSTLSDKSDHEIVTLLRALEPDVPAAVQAKIAVAVLGALYAAGRVSLRDVVSRLSSMATFTEGLADGERATMYGLDAALDLAQELIDDTLEQVREDVDAFFANYPLVSWQIAQPG